MLRRLALLCCATSLAAGCGLGLFDEGSGGADNLPISGAGPYRLQEPDFETPADEPYVVAQAIVSLLDPAVLPLDETSYEIFYSRLDDESSEIWRVVLPAISELPGEPTQVLRADAAWEEGAVGAAAVLRGDDSLVLYYRGGVDTPAIGRAISAGDGQPFVKDPDNPIASGDDPFVALVDGRYIMLHTDAEHRRIFWRESEDGRRFDEAREILARRTGTPLAFDSERVAGPALVATPTLDDRQHFGLFYAGSRRDEADELVEAIGYAGSFEGYSWERSLDGQPIFAAGPTGAGGPAPVIRASRATLFFHQPRQGRGRIGVALSP